MHPRSIHERARALRKQGLTHREIAEKLAISLGSAALWAKGVRITPTQRCAILKRAARRSFTPERRERLRQWAKFNLSRCRKEYTRTELLKKITDFYLVQRRIPLKRELNLYREYKKEFGSWNNAIRLLGFTPNPQLFAYKFHAKDGHRCDSFTEKIIDDWLSSHSIRYTRNAPYPGTRMTADFSLGPNVRLEFFGLAGIQRRYDVLIERKRNICRSCGITLLEAYPKDIFPENRLSELFK
jgi:hypothetical protein